MPACSHREHRAGAAEAGGHLVADEQAAVLVAQLAHAAHERRGLRKDAGRALHQRLHHDSGDEVALAREQRVEAREAFARRLFHRDLVAAPAPDQRRAQEGRVDLVHAERDRLVAAVEGLGEAEAHRADGVAVVGLRQRRRSACARARPSGAGTGSAMRSATSTAVRRSPSRTRASAARARCPPGASASSIGGHVREAEHRGVLHAVELRVQRGVELCGCPWPCTLHHSDDTPSR